MTSVNRMLITTDADTNKYLTLQPYTQSFTSSAVSVTAGNYILRTYTVLLSTDTSRYSLWMNMGPYGSTWRKAPFTDYVSGPSLIAANISASGSNITLNVYLVNQSPSTISFPAFDIYVRRRDYRD